MNKKIDGPVDVLGVRFFSGPRDELLNFLGSIHNRMLVVFTPTTEQLVMAAHDSRFRELLNQATLNVPDTIGVKWASGGRIKERLPGVDVAETLVLNVLKQGKTVFFLGGQKGVGAKAAVQFSELIIVDSGAVDIAHETEAERQRILAKIRETKPYLLLVAFGAPYQERWVMENREALEAAGVRVAMVVGGALDMWAGITPRAPMWVRKSGLEWLWRLLLQPWRLKRQLRLLEFVKLVLSQ